MKFPASIRQSLTRYEEHKRMQSLLNSIDHFLTLLKRCEYQGANPAIASVYNPLRASMIA